MKFNITKAALNGEPWATPLLMRYTVMIVLLYANAVLWRINDVEWMVTATIWVIRAVIVLTMIKAVILMILTYQRR